MTTIKSSLSTKGPSQALSHLILNLPLSLSPSTMQVRKQAQELEITPCYLVHHLSKDGSEKANHTKTENCLFWVVRELTGDTQLELPLFPTLPIPSQEQIAIPRANDLLMVSDHLVVKAGPEPSLSSFISPLQSYARRQSGKVGKNTTYISIPTLIS